MRCRRSDHLLVPSLHRAVALAQMNGVLELSTKNLDLHVSLIFQELLHVTIGLPKADGFGAGHVDPLHQRGLGMHHAHAAAATAAGGLDDHRVADRLGDADDFGSSGRAPSDRHAGTPAAFMASLAQTLSPIRRMVSGRGPMKVKPEDSTRSAKSAFSERKP